MAGQVIEIFFLGEDVSLRGFLASGKAPKNDWRFNLCGELGAAFGVNAIGLAVAALLTLGGRRGTAGAERDQN
jgi:hypothetical protein